MIALEPFSMENKLCCLLVPQDEEPAELILDSNSFEETIEDILYTCYRAPIPESGLIALVQLDTVN